MAKINFNLKALIKTLVLAPTVSGLVGFITVVATTAVSNLPSAVVTAAQAPLFAVVVGAIAFAIIVVDGLDDILVSPIG